MPIHHTIFQRYTATTTRWIQRQIEKLFKHTLIYNTIEHIVFYLGEWCVYIYIILCYIILYYIILYYIILYSIILYYIILYYTILYYIILYYIYIILYIDIHTYGLMWRICLMDCSRTDLYFLSLWDQILFSLAPFLSLKFNFWGSKPPSVANPEIHLQFWMVYRTHVW